VNFPPALQEAVKQHPYPLLFATISGAHLYGFPSPDSDYDLRGAHVLPVKAVIGLDPGEETVDSSRWADGIELDLVTHDVKKFFLLLLKRNGYVLEQLYSPLIVQGGPAHDELKEIARACITRHHSDHYLGFARKQWQLFAGEEPPAVKPLLYVYRVLLTGINLMNTGVIEANLLHLNEEFKLPYIAELVACKVNSREHGTLVRPDLKFHRAEYERLCRQLEQASAQSKLPEAPAARAALDNLLRRVRQSGSG
jgi:uncharacterized protein